MRGEPDADALAALTAPRRLTKAAAVDPVLGLVTPPHGAAAVHPGGTEVDAGDHRPRTPSLPAEKAPKKQKQGGYHAYPEDVDRARAAWFHTQLQDDGYRTWSDFQLAAVMNLTRQLEESHNGGKPWPSLPSGKVRSGRPAGT